MLKPFEGRSLNFIPDCCRSSRPSHASMGDPQRRAGVRRHRPSHGARIDAGAIVGQQRFPIRPEDTGLSLFSRCLAAGPNCSAHHRPDRRGEPLTDIPQDLTRRRLYRHRDALDGRIDWNDSAQASRRFHPRRKLRAVHLADLRGPARQAADADIEVLRAKVEPASRGEPGTIIDVSAEGPLIVCGDGAAIRIVKARRGRQSMSRAQWDDYLSHVPGRRLLGAAKPCGETARSRSGELQSIVGLQRCQIEQSPAAAPSHGHQ